MNNWFVHAVLKYKTDSVSTSTTRTSICSDLMPNQYQSLDGRVSVPPQEQHSSMNLTVMRRFRFYKRIESSFICHLLSFLPPGVFSCPSHIWATSLCSSVNVHKSIDYLKFQGRGLILFRTIYLIRLKREGIPFSRNLEIVFDS